MASLGHERSDPLLTRGVGDEILRALVTASLGHERSDRQLADVLDDVLAASQRLRWATNAATFTRECAVGRLYILAMASLGHKRSDTYEPATIDPHAVRVIVDSVRVLGLATEILAEPSDEDDDDGEDDGEE